MRKILLSVGTNHSLVGIRNTVFVNAGYAVAPTKSGAVALQQIQSRRLAAVIIGHSLSRSLKERITDAAKEKQLPVVVLHTYDHEAPVSTADANLCGIKGAAAILRVLRELLGESKCNGGNRAAHQVLAPAERPPIGPSGAMGGVESVSDSPRRGPKHTALPQDECD